MQGIGERICWTRMQTEAGESLDRILQRKDLERRAGGGLFFWGVGNAPARAIPKLARTAATVDVLFSVMKSRPKVHDVVPSRVFMWQRYVSTDGVVRSIPCNVLVTSRAGRRPCHYALMCYSDSPLAVSDMGPFDPAAFRNYAGGGGVGASQVTALLERHAPDGPSEYRIAMRAKLTGGLWVKLIDPVELTGNARAAMNHVPVDEAAWLDLVDCLRFQGEPTAQTTSPEEPHLFSI
jgi:hypothetical protein